MVVTARPKEGERIEPKTYIGGVRWRRWTIASWPLAKLTIEASGITIAPSVPWFPGIWRLLGIPTLHLNRSSIEVVELATGPFSLGHPEGISVKFDGRRVIFGCKQFDVEDIVEILNRFIPGKIGGHT